MFKLTEAEKNSALWMRISEEVTARLEQARIDNDYSMAPEKTEKLRGTISTWKEIQSWAITDPIFNE